MKLKCFLTLAVAVMMLLLIAACGNNANEPIVGDVNETVAETTAEPVVETTVEPVVEDVVEDNIIELRVLNYFSLINAGAMEEIERVWDAFEDNNPNIRLLREDEFEEPFHFATEAYAAAGTLPDVMFLWPSGRSTTLHENRLLLDLAPLVERDGLAAYFTPLTLDPAGQHGGYLAMIPRGITATSAFFVNMEVLEAAGLQPARTYSELVEQVPILREAGFDTILMANESTWVMQSTLFSLIAGRFMGEGWEQRVHDGELRFDGPEFIAALDFVRMMYEDGVICQSTLAIDYGSGPGLFATNTAAYYIDGDWRVGDFITDAATGEALIHADRQENFHITVFPEIDLPGVHFNRSNTAVLGTGWGMNANLANDPERMEAAWTLVKWLSGVETQTFLLETGGLPTPSRLDIDMDAVDLEPLQIAIANLGREYDISTVVIDGVFAGPVFTPLNDGLQAIGLGIQTPEQVAAIVQAAFEAWQAEQ